MRIRLLSHRSPLRRFCLGLGLGFLASVAVALATSQGYFSGYQGLALDLFFWARGRTRAPEIVLVGIDDAAFQGLNERQPLPRDYLAALVRGLRKSGARLICMDVDLRRPTNPADDRVLATAILGEPPDASGPVIVARTLTAVSSALGGDVVFRPSRLYDAALETASGFAEVPRDEDGYFRRIPLAVPLEDGQFLPSLALAMLARLGGSPSESVGRALTGPEPIVLVLPEWDEPRGKPAGVSPLRFFRDDDWKINFIGPAGSFLTVPSDAVYRLDIAESPVAQDNPFRDRIVLVGATFTESRDSYPTPRGVMTGVEIHANIMHSLLSRTQIRPIAWGTSLLLQFVLCLGLSALFAVVRPNRALIIAVVAAGFAVLAFHTGCFGQEVTWFDILTPILVIRLSGGLYDGVERRRIRRSFHQYVGQEVAERIYRDDRSLQGQRRTVTVMFTDLRDFTTLSESLAADQMAQQLNEYFPMMVEAVVQHRGIVNDFIGDAVMAVYGAPVAHPDHALDAVRTGLQMQAGLDALNVVWKARGLPTLRMGIGIHTGAVFAGKIGSAQRTKYTVVGDVVNVAARVEGLNKELQTTLLITGETYAIVQDRVQVKDCGPLKVKGRRQAVAVYEVLGLVNPVDTPRRRARWAGDGGPFWRSWPPWRRRTVLPPKPESPSGS
jgi:class 3 adenylate cyclase/CHASE2 domain-containing sensor protein